MTTPSASCIIRSSNKNTKVIPWRPHSIRYYNFHVAAAHLLPHMHPCHLRLCWSRLLALEVRPIVQTPICVCAWVSVYATHAITIHNCFGTAHHWYLLISCRIRVSCGSFEALHCTVNACELHTHACMPYGSFPSCNCTRHRRPLPWFWRLTTH